MKNYVQEGCAVVVPAPSAVASGDGVVVGSMFGVAKDAAGSGEDVVLQVEGVFSLPKTSAQAWTVGAKIYWTAGGEATTTSSGNTLIGVAIEAAVNPSAVGIVRLNGSF